MSEKLDLIRKYAREGDDVVPSRSSPRKIKPATPPAAVPPAGTPSAKRTPPPSGEVPLKGKPGVPVTSTPGKGVSYKPSPIRNMQKAIQDFANQTVSYKKDPRNPKAVSQEDKRKDFNDFLAEQYGASAKVHGEEWSPSEKATKKEQKQPTEIIELDNVINNLRRIGPGNKEAMPDGIWDFRTNNAVNNVYAFAEALVKSAMDFGSNIRGFTRADLIKMLRTIPGRRDIKKFSVQDLNQKAGELTPLIEKLIEYYKNYSKSILSHPQYVQYINKSTPLFKVQAPGTDPSAIPEDIKQYEGNLSDLVLKDVPIPNAQGAITYIKEFPLSYLKDMNSVYSLMMSKEVGFTREDIGNADTVSKVINEIANNISAKAALQQRG